MEILNLPRETISFPEAILMSPRPSWPMLCQVGNKQSKQFRNWSFTFIDFPAMSLKDASFSVIPILNGYSGATGAPMNNRFAASPGGHHGGCEVFGMQPASSPQPSQQSHLGNGGGNLQGLTRVNTQTIHDRNII